VSVPCAGLPVARLKCDPQPPVEGIGGYRPSRYQAAVPRRGHFRPLTYPSIATANAQLPLSGRTDRRVRLDKEMAGQREVEDGEARASKTLLFGDRFSMMEEVIAAEVIKRAAMAVLADLLELAMISSDTWRAGSAVNFAYNKPFRRNARPSCRCVHRQ